jgi:predicted ATP-grasp superfamily ATP-dependent carboligase|tara:strand:+ start:3584 stop:4282 length:699 start_codon:yes stop_codon:yes gene_type:complete
MKINLKKKLQNSTILGGFPGFGLIGTIASEYLIEHLNAEFVGSVWFSEMNPIIAIHNGKIVEPFGIFYSKKYNLIILHAITNVEGMEWKIAKAVSEISKKVKAKEIICIEGVGSIGGKDGVYFYSNKTKKKWEKTEVEPIKEGIVMGPTAALVLKLKKYPISCIFAETETGLPDSRAAAKTIEVLDKYLGLKVDYKPLVKKAEEFEDKLKKILESTKKIKEDKSAKEVSYMG